MCYGVRIIYVLAHSRTLTFAHVHMHSYMHIRDFSCKCSNTRDNKVDCLLRCTHLVRGNATVIAWVKRLDRQPLLLPVYLNVRQVSWMFHRLPFLAAGAIMHLPKPFQSCSRSSFFQSTFQEMFLVNHVVRWQRRLNYFDNGPFYIYITEKTWNRNCQFCGTISCLTLWLERVNLTRLQKLSWLRHLT